MLLYLFDCIGDPEGILICHFFKPIETHNWEGSARCLGSQFYKKKQDGQLVVMNFNVCSGTISKAEATEHRNEGICEKIASLFVKLL
jgi:hypothetical protein